MEGVNLTFYKEEDWDGFLESIDDRDSMHDTWKEWHKAYQKTKKGLIAKGFIVNDFVVDIDELINYCKIKCHPDDPLPLNVQPWCWGTLGSGVRH